MNKCPFCEKQYEQKSSLSVHVHRQHPRTTEDYVCECGRSFNHYQARNGHYRNCLIHRKGKPPAPSGMKGKPSKFKGKTLEEIVSNPEETRKKLSLAGSRQTPYRFTEEQKKMLSEKRIAYLESSNSHVDWYSVAGVKVQGSWERDVALHLVQLGIEFERVSLLYDGHRRYTPDFYIPVLDLYLEIKGFLRGRDVEKYRKVLKDCSVNLRFVWKFKELRRFLSQSRFEPESFPDFQQIEKLWVDEKKPF